LIRFQFLLAHDQVEAAGVEVAGDSRALAVLSAVAWSSIVQSPDRAHWLSHSSAGRV
jgi:hypothetical protein